MQFRKIWRFFVNPWVPENQFLTNSRNLVFQKTNFCQYLLRYFLNPFCYSSLLISNVSLVRWMVNWQHCHLNFGNSFQRATFTLHLSSKISCMCANFPCNYNEKINQISGPKNNGSPGVDQEILHGKSWWTWKTYAN